MVDSLSRLLPFQNLSDLFPSPSDQKQEDQTPFNPSSFYQLADLPQTLWKTLPSLFRQIRVPGLMGTQGLALNALWPCSWPDFGKDKPTPPPRPVIKPDPPSPQQYSYYGFKVVTAPDGHRHLAELDASGKTTGISIPRGFNISGYSKKTGLPCLPPCAEKLRPVFERMAVDGFNFIRLPVVWEHMEKTPGIIDPAMAAELKSVVDEAAKYGIYVLIDLHQDLMGTLFRRKDKPDWHGNGFPKWLLELAYDKGREMKKKSPGDLKDPSWAGFGDSPWGINYKLNSQLRYCMRGLGHEEVQKHITDFFTRLGAIFKDSPNIFGYDVMNEPYSEDLYGPEYVAYAKAAQKGLLDSGALSDSSQRHSGIAGLFQGLATAISGPSGDTTPAAALDPGGDWAFSTFVWDQPPRLAVGPKHTRATITGPIKGFAISTGHMYDPRALMHIPLISFEGDTPEIPEAEEMTKSLELLERFFPDGISLQHLVPPEPTRYDDAVQLALDRHKEWNMVFILGEWGVPNNVKGHSRAYLNTKWLDALESRRVPWLRWHLHINRDATGDDGWMGEELSVAWTDTQGQVRFEGLGYDELLRPQFHRTSGDLEFYEYKPGTPWTFKARIGKANETGWTSKLFIPASLGNCTVTVQGEVKEIKGNQREVTFDTDDGPVEVMVEPSH